MFSVKVGEVSRTIRMKDMKPGSIGRIEDKHANSHGDVIMRTYSENLWEVINLSSYDEFEHWTDKSSEVKVKLFPSGTKITLEVK